MPSFSNFLHTQLFLQIPKPTSSFHSKTVIVTGGNTGLGKEAVKHIVSLNASKVIIACRDRAKGQAAKVEIESLNKSVQDVIEVWPLDLGSDISIGEFAARANKLSRLDVLINNAGIMSLNHDVVHGTEKTVGINVVGTMLLAALLLPKMKQTANMFGETPHMTFVSSALYASAKYPEELSTGGNIFEWLQKKEHVPVMKNQYNLSKLLLNFEIRKLASIIDPLTGNKPANPNPIVINCLDPCFCSSGLGREFSSNVPVAIKIAFKIFVFLFARTSEVGSRLIVQAASAGRETHGGYMRAGKLTPWESIVTGDIGASREQDTWEHLGTKLEEFQPGILASLNLV